MLGITIWGPGPVEYRFLWRSLVAVFAEEAAATTLVQGHLQDSAVAGQLRGLLSSRGRGSAKKESLAGQAAKMLHGGELVSSTARTGSFHPMWRYHSRFRDRIFALQFLTRFQRNPLALVRLRALLQEKNPGPALAQLSDQALLAEIATRLGTGELTVAYLLHLTPGSATAQDAEPAPIRRAAPEVAALRRAPSAKEEEQEKPTFAAPDGVAQAAALRAAAQSGVPFCEECVKAALAGRR